MEKYFASPQKLLEYSYQLVWDVYNRHFNPTYVIRVWRGGGPIAIAAHELLKYLLVKCDHFPIKISSYKDLNSRRRDTLIEVLQGLCKNVGVNDRLLIVDGVHDTGLSLGYFLKEFPSLMNNSTPETRIATLYFKPNRNKTNNVPDYFLYTIDDWVVSPHELQRLPVNELKNPTLANFIFSIRRWLYTKSLSEPVRR